MSSGPIFETTIIKKIEKDPKGGRLTPSILYIFRTKLPPRKVGIKVYVNDKRQTCYRTGYIDYQNAFTSTEIVLYKTEEEIFRNTLAFCLSNYKKENAQYLWYHFQ